MRSSEELVLFWLLPSTDLSYGDAPPQLDPLASDEDDWDDAGLDVDSAANEVDEYFADLRRPPASRFQDAI